MQSKGKILFNSPVLVQQCQKGLCCIRKWGDSYGDFINPYQGIAAESVLEKGLGLLPPKCFGDCSLALEWIWICTVKPISSVKF